MALTLRDGLQFLNTGPATEVESTFLTCCGSTAWARAVAAARPFPSAAALCETADRIWRSLPERDWLEAFAAHPKIGAAAEPDHRPAAGAPSAPPRPHTGGQVRRWAIEEQSGTEGASGDTLSALAEANRAYEARFGYIFIVCATGKTAGEMLARLRARLANEPSTEIRVAAEEQRQITRLRLAKVLEPS